MAIEKELILTDVLGVRVWGTAIEKRTDTSCYCLWCDGLGESNRKKN